MIITEKLSSANSSQILIYEGRGVSQGLVESMRKFMEIHLNKKMHCIETFRADEAERKFVCPTSLLIIPGGNAIFMNDELSTISEKIRKIVLEHNIPCFGSCAGSIFLGQEMLYPDMVRDEQDGVLFVQEPYLRPLAGNTIKTLNLYPGLVAAPLLQAGLPEKPCKFDVTIDQEFCRESAYIETMIKVNSTIKESRFFHLRGPWYPNSHKNGAEILSSYDSKFSQKVANLPIGTYNRETMQLNKCGSLENEETLASTILYSSPFGYKLLLCGLHPEFEANEITRKEMNLFQPPPPPKFIERTFSDSSTYQPDNHKFLIDCLTQLGVSFI